MKWAYCRCSTTQDKQSLDRQIRFAINNGVSKENIYKEYASGAKAERIEFKKLLEYVKLSNVESKEIYFSDVSRATRSLKQLMELVEYAKQHKVKLVFGDFIIDCRNNLSALTEGQLLMLGLVAELTRLIIVENVKDGLITAREQGRIGGQPKLTKERIYAKCPNFAKYYIDYVNGHINLIELSRLCCVSRNTITNWINIVRKS